MGSLASRPKAPSVARTVYMPVYTPAAPAPVNPLPTGQVDAPVNTSAATEEDQASSRRAASLLERRRGVLSTVLTGFRGILSQTATEPRKTLLGE